MASQQLDRELHHHSFPGPDTQVVTCLQIDRDKIVSATIDRTISVHDTANGELRGCLVGHETGVWAMQYVDDILISGSTDSTVRIWNLDTMEPGYVFSGHTSTVRSLRIVEPVLDRTTGTYQPPHRLVVTGSRDRTLRVWKLPQKEDLPRWDSSAVHITPPDTNPYHMHCLEGHTGAVRDIAVHGGTCISGSYDQTVRVWDILTGRCKRILRGHEEKGVSGVASDCPER